MAFRRKEMHTLIESKNRQSLNLINFTIALCFTLLFSAQVTDTGFTTRLNVITQNLDKAMVQIMDSGKVNFTEFNSTVTYNPRIMPFNSKGMAGLYNLTNMFMKIILTENINMSDVIQIENNRIHYRTENQLQFMLSLVGVAIVLVILLLFLVFFPLCGFFFCCCRCCGNCGARSKPCDKKQDLCKKFIHGTMLILLTTLLLFCVVCAFTSNQQLNDGVNELVVNVKSGVEDSSQFLTNINKEMEHLLKDNYDEFEKVLISTINSSGQSVMGELEDMSNATAMTQMHDIVFEKLPAIEASFKVIKNDTNQLRVYANQLNDGVRMLKRDLLSTLQNCNLDTCRDLSNNINHLQTTIDFNKLPDVSAEIQDFENLVDLEKLQIAASAGMRALNNLQDKINDTLSKSLVDAVNQINKAGVTINRNLDNVTRVIKSIRKSIQDESRPIIREVDEYIQNYNIYIYYGGLALSCVLLLVTICITLGLICGICGKRPDGYTDNCCNKGSGSQFLICAVLIIFLCGFVFAVVAICGFVFGLFSHRLVCYPLRHPQESLVLKTVDEALNLSNYGINFTIANALHECHRNGSAYNVFNLKHKFDLGKAVSKFDINGTLDKLNITSALNRNITILDASNKNALKGLMQFSPDVNFDQFSDELKGNFTNYSLEVLEEQLKNLINNLSKMNTHGTYSSILTSLQLNLVHLNAYNEKLVTPMKEMANSVINISLNLNDNLNMGYGSFPNAIGNLTLEIEHAESIINSEGRNKLKNITEVFKRNVRDQINTYTNRVVFFTENKVGQCGPLSSVINSTLTTTCDKILIPLNGFWFTMFSSLLLFFPTILVSVKLASLYQKYKTCGAYVETEYLYDAYADRGDSIPLNSRSSSRGKKNKKPKRYEDRPTIPGDVLPRDFASGSHPQDTRYADMAPKQWEEFPAGGPPQYQRAPTEYERPPPYYYPDREQQ